MSGSMEGKSGLVTAAGSGIGRASAMLLAAEGAKVVVSDMCAESGLETVDMIRRSGGNAIFERCDVAIPDEIDALVKRTVQHFGRLDFAHNHAGAQAPQGPLIDTSFADWSHVFKINLDSVFWSLKFQIAAMIDNGGGAIVNTASTGALRTFSNNTPYTTSKCAIVHLTKCVAREVGKHNIRVNALCPGMTLTPMAQKWVDEVPERAAQVAGGIPLGRIGNPAEQADAVLWLCSDRSSYVSGIALPVDGGDTA